MNIFVKIKNSIYNPEYYSEVAKKPFSYSFKYLLIFALLFAMVFAIVVIIRFIPIVNLLSQKAPELANYFPQELTITIKDGKVSTNVQEPYFIKVPAEMKGNTSLKSANITINGGAIQTDTTKLDNLVVIDTKDKFDLDTFNSYKTFMLITADSVVYMNKNNQISISSLSGIKDFTLNRGKITGFVGMAKPFLVILYPIVFVGAYIAGYMIVVVKMAYLLFGALLIWAVAKIKGIELGYKKSYIVGMQLVTGAIIITSILSAISPKLTFPYFFSVLLIALAFANLKKPAVQPTTQTV